jgi:CHASE2 domain-containing sensor protein
MIDLELAEYIVFVGALVVAFFILREPRRPRHRIPAWALFALNVGLSGYWLLHLLEEGPNVPDAMLLIASIFLAARVWWRDLRDAS